MHRSASSAEAAASPCAPGAREAPDPLLELEQPLALLLDEHPPEQVAEQADVPAEGGVGTGSPFSLEAALYCSV